MLFIFFLRMKMGGSQSVISIGRISFVRGGFDSALYEKKTSGLKCGIDFPSIPVQLPNDQVSIYDNRKDSWKKAMETLRAKEATVTDIEIDCRFHTFSEDRDTWDEIFNGLQSDRFSMKPPIGIHFVYVSSDMLDKIVSFIKAFDFTGRTDGRSFHYNIIPAVSW
jgi:hypothetical protein